MIPRKFHKRIMMLKINVTVQMLHEFSSETRFETGSRDRVSNPGDLNGYRVLITATATKPVSAKVVVT